MEEEKQLDSLLALHRANPFCFVQHISVMACESETLNTAVYQTIQRVWSRTTELCRTHC